MMDQAIDILNRLSLGILLSDVDGKALPVNRAGESLLAACGGGLPAPPGETSREYRVERNGRTIEITASPFENKVLFTLKDVTDLIRAKELEKRREKYAVMGELTAGIAHEIRNPLGSIELFASLLKRELKKGKNLRRVDHILSSVKTLDRKLSRLILFSQGCERPPDEVNIHDILKEILHYSEQVIDQEMIYLSVKTADMAPFIVAHPDMIRQIFSGLILIALQSLPLSSRLEVETVHVPEPPSIEVHFRAEGRDFLERVSGTDVSAGMGLAIIHHIMNMHRGAVRIEQSGAGRTAVILSFPLAVDQQRPLFEGKP